MTAVGTVVGRTVDPTPNPIPDPTPDGLVFKAVGKAAQRLDVAEDTNVAPVAGFNRSLAVRNAAQNAATVAAPASVYITRLLGAGIRPDKSRPEIKSLREAPVWRIGNSATGERRRGASAGRRIWSTIGRAAVGQKRGIFYL